MTIPVIGLGAGGHAKVVIDTIRMTGQYEVIGLLDPDLGLHGKSVLGIPVLGDDEILPTLAAKIKHFFVGLGSIGNSLHRERLYQMAVDLHFEPINVVHPTALVSPSVELGKGISIFGLSVINAAARIGDNVIINTGAIVEHDCMLENHVHVATGAKLASTVHVAAGSHIGAGATVKQCVSIGHHAIVGAGAAVVCDVKPNSIVVGVPAKPLALRT